MKQGNAHPVDAAADEFSITRILDAPRELVFTAWTDPSHLARWWGPRIFTNPVCEMDVRPGGAYRIVMRSPEGIDYPLKGIFKEIAPPERLVMTMDCSEHPPEWQDLVDPQRARGNNDPVGEMLMTVTFGKQAGRTVLSIGIHFRSAAIRDVMVKMGMNEGWSQSLDRLATLVSVA